MDWLAQNSRLPGLPVWTTMDVQYRTESCQSSAKPTAVQAANERADVPAARRSPRLRKNSTNAAGVELHCGGEADERAARPARVREQAVRRHRAPSAGR